MVIHFKTGVYETGHDKILCNRFVKNESKIATSEDKDKVTCGLCLISLRVRDQT